MEKCGLRFIEEYDEPHFPGEDKRAVLYRLTREEYASGVDRPEETPRSRT
ncbi:MAG: hypothetical protein RLY93_19580 [Sumerlaeia bacterium]